MVKRNETLKRVLRNGGNQKLTTYSSVLAGTSVVVLTGIYLAVKKHNKHHNLRHEALIRAIRSQIAEKEKQEKKSITKCDKEEQEKDKKERLRKLINDLKEDVKTPREKKGNPDLYPFEDCHVFCVNHLKFRTPDNQQSLKLFNDDDVL